MTRELRTPRASTELSRLPDEELVVLARAKVDSMRDPAGYQESLHAAILAERRGLIASVAQEAEERREDRVAEKSRKRKEKRLRRATEGDVVLPAWWFTSGRWAKLDAAGVRVAPVLAALVRNPGQHVTLGEVSELIGKSVDTAARGIDSCHQAGLIRKHTKDLPVGNLVRRSIFITIPEPQ